MSWLPTTVRAPTRRRSWTNWRERGPLAREHVWQPDEGWRKSRTPEPWPHLPRPAGPRRSRRRLAYRGRRFLGGRSPRDAPRAEFLASKRRRSSAAAVHAERSWPIAPRVALVAAALDCFVRLELFSGDRQHARPGVLVPIETAAAMAADQPEFSASVRRPTGSSSWMRSPDFERVNGFDARFALGAERTRTSHATLLTVAALVGWPARRDGAPPVACRIAAANKSGWSRGASRSVEAHEAVGARAPSSRLRRARTGARPARRASRCSGSCARSARRATRARSRSPSRALAAASVANPPRWNPAVLQNTIVPFGAVNVWMPSSGSASRARRRAGSSRRADATATASGVAAAGCAPRDVLEWPVPSSTSTR